MSRIKHLKNQIIKLSDDEKSILLIELTQEVNRAKFNVENQNKCPLCDSKKTKKSGKFNGKQRYLCEDCGKRFSKTSGTILHSVKLKSKFLEYKIYAYRKGNLTAKQISSSFGIGIATAYRWRKKLLFENSYPEELSFEKKKLIGTMLINMKKLKINEFQDFKDWSTMELKMGVEYTSSLYLQLKQSKNIDLLSFNTLYLEKASSSKEMKARMKIVKESLYWRI